jgi:hypothetical protein
LPQSGISRRRPLIVAMGAAIVLTEHDNGTKQYDARLRRLVANA